MDLASLHRRVDRALNASDRPPPWAARDTKGSHRFASVCARVVGYQSCELIVVWHCPSASASGTAAALSYRELYVV